MSMAASTARYKASSPDVTEMLRTKGPRVPKIAIEATIIKRDFFMWITSRFSDLVN